MQHDKDHCEGWELAGLIFDEALMDLAHLKVGDQSDVTVHEGGRHRADARASDHRTAAGGGDGAAVDSQELRVVQPGKSRSNTLNDANGADLIIIPASPSG